MQCYNFMVTALLRISMRQLSLIESCDVADCKDFFFVASVEQRSADRN